MNLAQIGGEIHNKRIQAGLLQEHVAKFAGGSESRRRGGHTRRPSEENHEKPQPVGEAMESMSNGLVMAGAPDIPPAWETLFSQALKVIGEISRHGREPQPARGKNKEIT